MAVEVLNLDSLVPQPRTVKFGDDTFDVAPPKTADVLRLGALGQKFTKSDALDSGDLDKLVTDLTAQIVKCVPQLEGKDLNTAQLMAIMQLITEMAMPADAAELKARGIEPASPKVQ